MRLLNSQKEQVEKFFCLPAGNFPNNRAYPVILYKQVFSGERLPGAALIEEAVAENNWLPAWRFSVYSFDHYHSTAFEFLGCFTGDAVLQFGGPEGKVVNFRCGDAVIIPPGVGHRQLDCSYSFCCVGAYPPGQSPDLLRGRRPVTMQSRRNIAAVSPPLLDPVYGVNFSSFIAGFCS